MAVPDEQTFPATSGTVSGWFGIGACVLLIGSLALSEPSLGNVRFGIGLVLIAVLVYAFMLRPRVRVTREAVVLVNPLEQTTVPFALVTDFVVRQATFVHVGETRYVGVAIGRPLRQVVRGGDTAPGSPPGLGRLARNDVTPTRRNATIDLLEERVRSGRRDAQDRAASDPGAGARVVRDRTWWLVGTIAGLAVVFAASFLF